jgi:CRP-like cAMP-binding protein
MNLLIENIRALIPLSAADKEIIKTLFRKKLVTKGEHILRTGEVCKYVFFIEKGLVRYYLSAKNEEQTYFFSKEGEWGSDYPSFIPKVPTMINIQALEDSVIWQINYNDLQTFYQKIKHGERFGRLGIEHIFISITGQLYSFYTDKPKARYQRFLQSYYDVAQRIPQYFIASYVGVKPQSLSRIRKKDSTLI